MKRRIIILLLCLLLAAALLMCGCSKQEQGNTDNNPEKTPSSGNTDAPEVPAYEGGLNRAPEKGELVTGNGWTISADMTVLLDADDDRGYWDTDRDVNSTELVTFTTEKPVESGALRITGTLQIASESQLLDIDETAYWTDEDWEEYSKDQNYVPQVTLPTVEEVLEMNLNAMENQLPRKELQLGEITVKTGAGTSAALDGSSTVYNLFAVGDAGMYLCCINLSIEVFNCNDNQAQLDAAIAMAEEWLATVEITASELAEPINLLED